MVGLPIGGGKLWKKNHRDGGRLWQFVRPELDGTAQELILIRQLF